MRREALRDFALIPVAIAVFVALLVYAGVLWVVESLGVEV